MRNFPKGWDDIVFGILTAGGYNLAKKGIEAAVSTTETIADAVTTVTNNITVNGVSEERVKELIDEALGGAGFALSDDVSKQLSAVDGKIKNAVDRITVDQRSIDNSVTNNNTYVNKQNVQRPDIRGCSNGSALGKPYPFVLGRTYCSPNYINTPYYTVSGDKGHNLTYHALYLLSVNEVNVTDICLGLHTLAKNTAKQRAGAINVSDGEYSDSDYGLRLEVQNSNEVSIFDQKVVQQDLNKELMRPEGTLSVEPWDLEFSSPYPQKVEVEIGLDGLVGKDSDGKETFGSVGIKLEYSTDGGQTYKDFGTFACTGLDTGESVTHNATTHETVFTMKDYHSMRLVATKTFSTTAEIAEVRNAVNNVLEIRIQRSTAHVEDNYIYDTVTLKAIRTYCYDPETSTASTLAKQPPLVLKDRQRTTRLGFQITSTEKNGLQDLQQFNCTLQALGRTCTESGGSFTWSQQESETCNPASMALKVLQSNALGSYKYADDEIDLQSFGELYKFCDEYDIDDIGGNHVGICCNGIISSQKKLSDHLNDILSVGRATRIYNGNKIGVFVDKPIATTTLILNNQNVLSATNQKNFDELPSGIKAGFVNEDNYAQKDSMYIDYADAPARSSLDYVTISKDFVYQTNVEQIQKNGLYELAKLKLRPETWNRKVTSEGSLAFIGAKIEIQDDTVAVGIGDGAEIIGLEYDDEEHPSYITKIITDGHFEVTDTTETYGVKIQHADSTVGICYIKKQVTISQGGVYSEFTLTDPISLNEICPVLGDILSFGLFSKITFETICFGKQDNGDGTYDLTVVPYDEGIYNADSGQLPEFQSKVTVPSYYRAVGNTKIASKDEVRNVQKLVEEGSVSLIPSTPTNLTATAYQDYIKIDWLPNGNELKDSIKEYVIYCCKDITAQEPAWVVIGRSGTNSFQYNFDRSTDGYVNATGIAKWRIKILGKNIYGNDSSFTSAVEVTTFVGSADYVWNPKAVTITIPKATKDGFFIEWTKTGNNLGTSKYVVKVYDGQTLLFTSSKLTDTFYQYTFDRSRDGYPEKSTFTGTRNLQNYVVKVEHRNEAVEASAVQPTENQSGLNLDGYGTWRIAFALANVSKDVVDRTVTLKLSASGGNLVLYGETKYKVSIKRTAIDYAGQSSDYPSFTPDTSWYKPDLYSDPLVSESNYRTDDVGGYEECSGRYSQTLPLIGQDTNNIVNTIYAYRISAFNESGFETSAVEISATALCTSIRDIVKAHADYKELYVEKLSAITANLGMISQGGMGDFDNLENCWALTDLSPTDTGLSETIMKGTMRVGDDNEFFRVTPYIDPIDPTVRRYKIELKAGNISLTSNIGGDSLMDFTGGTYIYDNVDPTKRLALTSRGIIAQQNIGTAQRENWQDITFVRIDERGNMIISNTTNTPEFGLKVTGDIYHFDDRSHPNYAESGSNTQNITTNGTCIANDSQNPIISDKSSQYCFEGDITKSISSFTGSVVLFSKSDTLVTGSIGVQTDGTILSTVANEYNQYIKSARGSGTVGSYLGLTQAQITNGIFANAS